MEKRQKMIVIIASAVAGASLLFSGIVVATSISKNRSVEVSTTKSADTNKQGSDNAQKADTSSANESTGSSVNANAGKSADELAKDSKENEKLEQVAKEISSMGISANKIEQSTNKVVSKEPSNSVIENVPAVKDVPVQKDQEQKSEAASNSDNGSASQSVSASGNQPVKQEEAGSYSGTVNQAAEGGSDNEIIRQLEEVLTYYPEKPELNFNLSMEYFKMGNYDRGLKYLLTANKLEPKMIYSNYATAVQVLRNAGYSEQAKTLLELALRNDPDHAVAYNIMLQQ